jgi:hypothetical protein
MQTIKDESRFAELLIPVKKVVFLQGSFRWPKKTLFVSPYNTDNLPLRQLGNKLSQYGIKTYAAPKTSGTATLRMVRCSDIKNPEAYGITISSEGINIYAGEDAGAYYAVQTLCDLITIYGQRLPNCKISDEPDFARRGIYHDCSRGKVPRLETLKELVTWLAHLKINELQLYIENVFTFKRHPDIGKGYSPFTAEQILSLQEHCKMHHIRLAGSLASFGHFEKILALPRYRHLGELPGFRNFPGGTTLCPTDKRSIRLIEELYREFVPLFEAEDFNACCDETWELGKGRSKSEAERIGTGRVYLNFLLKIHRLCEKYGKRMNIWADIVLKYPELLKELPKDIVLLNWGYEQNGPNIYKTKEIAESKRQFMVCPGTSGWLTHGSRLPNSMGNVANFAVQGRRYNAMGLLNTDWGDDGHRNFLGVSLHSFAHGAAHSWNGKAVDDSKFTEKFCRHIFGQKTNRMAKSLRMLGNTYRLCGKQLPNKSLLYYALVEPLLKPQHSNFSAIDMTDKKGLEKIIVQMSGKNLWPAPTKDTGHLEQAALQELELAARMDCIACKRTLAAKLLRAGGKITKSRLRELTLNMNDLAKDFKRLWLLRNKVSRLYDNIRLFRRAEQETKLLL